jgi:TolB-like protein/DNA-binding winged helix-turn-helix (wHTH) protein/Flp pilus assembly protein TadD
MIHRELYEFGPFALDPHERTLWREGVALATTPKVFDTLLCLVQNPGRILTKDELLQEIWPGTFVEEVNLAVNISTLRKLLGESPQDGRYILTVSGRGYRFVAQVRKTDFGSDGTSPDEVSDLENSEIKATNDSRSGIPQSLNQSEWVDLEASHATIEHPKPAGVFQPTPSRLSINRKLATSLAVVLLLSIAAGIYLWRRHTAQRMNPAVDASIAVLPFADLSQNQDQEYFADGLADELTNDLAKVRGLKVIARSSAFQFKGKNEDLRFIGQKLGVANILEGSVRREGNRVRITTELTKVNDGFQLWSETYDRQIDDVFTVQEEIARAVSVALQVRIMNSNRDFGSSRIHLNPEAYEPYLQAQYFLARGEDKEDLDKALGYIDHAVKIDPGFAPAWALRSTVIDTSATIGLRNHEESYREARENAEKAIALDSGSAAGYVALAWVKISYAWDWHGADADLKKAADLQPGSAVILSYRAYLYECLGRLDEAIALTEEASALDPLRTNAYLGALLYLAGRYDEGRAAVQKALAINPKLEGAHFTLGNILLAQGNLRNALAEMESEPGEWQRLTGQALVYHALNRSRDSDTALSKLIATHAEDSPYQVAEVYAYRGETNKAFEWLERAYRERDPGLNQLKLDPLLRSLRSEPRFSELLIKMGLPT